MTRPTRAFRSPELLLILLPLLFTLLASTDLNAQQNAGNAPGEEVSRERTFEQAILRWDIFLGSTAQDARTVFPEERRPFAIVEAANAYWETHPDVAESLFVNAVDSAISLSRQDKKNQYLINYVLASAAKRDARLTEELNDRLKAAGLKIADEYQTDLAMDLIDSDPATAARLIEVLAPAGAQSGWAMSMIYQLARKNKGLSDRVYGVYLQRIAAEPTIGIGVVDFFAGYAFGYSEYCGITANGGTTSNSLVPNHALAQRRFTADFLNLAYGRTAAAIEARNRSIGTDLDALNLQIAFTFEYLLPEISRFAPNNLAVWQQLQQQGIAGIPIPILERARSLVQSIYQTRSELMTSADSPEISEQQIDAQLDDIEKMVGTCKRDAAYSKAAMRLAGLKNYKRAFEVAGKIETPEQEADVLEYIRVRLAEAAIESGEPDVEKQIEKISKIEYKSLLYGKLAEKTRNRVHIDQAVRVAENLPKPEDRAGMLFGLSTFLIDSDAAAAQSVFRNAVKELNRTEPVDQMKFRLSMNVSVGCDGEHSFFGWGGTIANSTIFDAISEFAKRDPDTAVTLAREIGDKITKLRAQAVIANIALADLEKRKAEYVKSKTGN